MSRKAHLVGAWPGRDPEHAMDLALNQLGPYLARMSDGETGYRHLWATPMVEKFRANTDVEMINDGGFTGYEDTPKWRLREGTSLNPDTIGLYYTHAFEIAFPSFKVLRERYDRTDLRFQVGIMAPIDHAAYAFGELAFKDPSILEALTVAAAHEIEKIQAQGGAEVVFQIETVVSLISAAKVPADGQQAVVDKMAATLLDLVSRAPSGTRFGFHLCLGDFHHKAYGHMEDCRPLVLLANAIAAGWPADKPLEYIHAPFAAAAEPPIEDEAFYEPLKDLDLPAETRFVAGFQHEKLDLDEHRDLLARIERLTGREVDVAAACGLGRRPSDEEAFEQMRETRELLETPSPSAV